ncbi:hypothetical protein BKA59DRAFT_559734 [Fusarium tricinctum]|uniref:Phosphoinositide phospholipase C n=1 Tax=Fusarium tricinctum TaxID=61284 RepID=A0A8K0W8U3_9HYPO|nr:hypothetical protein BKA59DRAFT_559734 [Fusarium tricinctum]
MDLMLLSARDLSNKCLKTFQQCLTFHPTDSGSLHQMVTHDEQFEYRLADFNLWIDGIGALAPAKASLDSRLGQRQIDLSLVKGNLIMLIQSLEDCFNLLKTSQSLQDALLDFDSALENLVSISLAIRRTGRRSRLHKADRLFNPEEHEQLRKHLEAIILLRPGEGPCDGDNEFKEKMDSLTTVQKHLVIANLKRRNRYIQAHLHSLGLKRRSAGFEQQPIPETGEKITTSAGNSMGRSGAVAIPNATLLPQKLSQPLAAPMSVTSASIPESKLEYREPVSKTPDSTPMTVITQITASARYPRPRLSSSEQVVQCPCCCQMLPVSEAKNNNQWRCPAPDVYYSNRSMLEQHFRQDHPPVWECPLCHHGAAYSTMAEIMDHLQNTHPQVSGEDIPAIISSSAQAKMGIGNCPLCEVQGDIDSPQLIDHVLEHIHDFSLRSLPWPTSSMVDMGGEVGSFNPECEASVLISQWLEGYEHVTKDIDPDLELSNCDHGRLEIIAEQIQPREQDKFGLDIYFADEHGDESAEAETDISQLTQDTLDSLKRASQASEADEDHDEEHRSETGKNKSTDLGTQTEPKVVETLDQLETLNSQAYDVLSKLYQRRIDSVVERKSHFSDFIRSVQGQETPTTNHSVSDLHSFVQVMADHYLCALKPLPPKDLTKEISNYFINTSYQTLMSTGALKWQGSIDSIHKALSAGYRSIEMDVWDGHVDSSLRPLTVHHREKPARPFAEVEALPVFEVPKGTLYIADELGSRKMPVVTGSWPSSDAFSFGEVCVLIRNTAFLNNNMPIIVNFTVHAGAAQQQMMVDIMKEEWHGFLLDEPIDGCDPRFKLPRLGDLQNRILVNASRPANNRVDRELPGTSTLDDPPRKLLIQPLESLNVYLKSEIFERFEPRQSKTPIHVFSWQENELGKLISASPVDLLEHNRNYLCHVYPSSTKPYSKNLDPSRFWEYGVQMAAIRHCIVDEGLKVNSGLFGDEEGWVLKPFGFRNANEDIPNHIETTTITIQRFSILVFKDQRFQLMKKDGTREQTQDLSPLAQATIHSWGNSCEFRSQDLVVKDDDSDAFGYIMTINAIADIIPELTVITMTFSTYSYREILSRQQLLVKINFECMK